MANRANLANGVLGEALTPTQDKLVFDPGYRDTMPPVPFYLTLTPFGQLPTMRNSEIVKVIDNRASGSKIERAQKGTSAKSFPKGSLAINSVYADDKVRYDSVGSDGFISFLAVVPASYHVPTRTFFKINATEVKYNLGNGYDGANARFVAPIAGYYSFSLTFKNDVNGSGRAIARFNVAGDDNYRVYDGSGGQGGITSVGSIDVKLNAGDVVYTEGWLTTSPLRSAENGYTSFGGRLIVAEG